MDYRLSVRKAAEIDIAESFDYYESCHKNLGMIFCYVLKNPFVKSSAILSSIKKFTDRSGAFLSAVFPMGFIL